MLHYKKTFVHLVANTNTLVAKLGKHSAHTRKHHRARHASNGTKGRVLVKHLTLPRYVQGPHINEHMCAVVRLFEAVRDLL